MPDTVEAEQESQRSALQRRTAVPTAGTPPTGPPAGRTMHGLLLHLQRTAGNRAVNGLLQRWKDEEIAQGQSQAETPEEGPATRQITAPLMVQRDDDDGPSAGSGSESGPGLAPADTPAPADPAPAEQYIVPFDHNPLSAPGEKIIFVGEFTHPSPNAYQLKYTGTGGTFDSDAGSASKTIAGLTSGNAFFFITKTWDASTTVSMKLEVQRISDSAVVKTFNWTFAKKATVPTTIQQQEDEAEVSLPGHYSYKVGPALHPAPGAGPDYEHLTILERFGQRTCNITLDELKPAFKTAHPDITTADQITAHFFGTSSNNGTFTVDHTDMIYDVHGGGVPDLAVFTNALITMKDVTCDLPQTYEVTPGAALGNFTIRRIIKADGSKMVKKMKT